MAVIVAIAKNMKLEKAVIHVSLKLSRMIYLSFPGESLVSPYSFDLAIARSKVR